MDNPEARRIAVALERIAEALERLHRTAVIIDTPRPGPGVTQDGTQPERMRG
jgi:hypothetical protein